MQKFIRSIKNLQSNLLALQFSQPPFWTMQEIFGRKKNELGNQLDLKCKKN